MIKWKSNKRRGDTYYHSHAQVGHLFVEIFTSVEHGKPGDHDHEPETHNWSVCPDNDDKCDERSYRQGVTSTLDEAKTEALQALCEMAQHILDMIAVERLSR